MLHTSDDISGYLVGLSVTIKNGSVDMWISLTYWVSIKVVVGVEVGIEHDW